jgi:phosphoglycolate phosphatase
MSTGRTATQLVVLDMAGTTITDHGVVQQSVDAALQCCGLAPISPADLQPLRGLAKKDMFRQLAPDAATAGALHQAFNGLMLEAVSAGALPPRTGAGQTLAALRERGIKTCLMTGFEPVVQSALLKRLGWRDDVDLAVAPSSTLRGRPYPDLILHAVLALHVDDVRSVVVAGDTTNDLYAGTRAGAGQIIGVLGGAHARDLLSSAPHTAIVDSVPDILTLI